MDKRFESGRNRMLEIIIDDFQKALGIGNASLLHDTCIELIFDLNDAKVCRLFNEFGQQTMARKVEYGASAHGHKLIIDPENPDDNKIKIMIPLDEDCKLHDLAYVARILRVRADVRYCINDLGETYRMVLPDDPAHVLVQTTDVPWVRVVANSRYDDSYVQPKLPDAVDDETRRKQEFSLGYNILPNNGNVVMEVRDWLDNHRTAERRRGLPPATAIPADWIDRESNQERLWQNHAAVKTVLAPNKKG